MKLFLQILAGIGFVVLASAGLTYISSVNFVNHAQLVTGSVVALPMSIDPDDNTSSYCPQVSYMAQTGQVITFDSNVCSSPAAYHIGEQVEVYYDPQHPQDAQIKNFSSQYLVSISLTCIGLPIAVVGMLGLFLHKKREQTSQDLPA
jgi:hypothetical protein